MALEFGSREPARTSLPRGCLARSEGTLTGASELTARRPNLAATTIIEGVAGRAAGLVIATCSTPRGDRHSPGSQAKPGTSDDSPTRGTATFMRNIGIVYYALATVD